MQRFHFCPVEIPESPMDLSLNFLAIWEEQLWLVHLCAECFKEPTGIHATYFQNSLFFLKLLEEVILVLVYLG